MNYGFHPAAEAEHLDQIAFYESRQRGLGARYRDHFMKAIETACAAPTRFAVDQPPDIRRIRLQPFPLTIIFRQHETKIQILAIAHYRRPPRYWLDRIT
jgi:plasmid stabilization system protein ParE